MAVSAPEGIWKHCNICKSPIAFRAEYFVCSVSTCNRKRTGLIFCSLPCFEAHLPTARHRDAWAEREKAPTESEWRATLAASAAAKPEPAALRGASGGPNPAGAAGLATGPGAKDSGTKGFDAARETGEREPNAREPNAREPNERELEEPRAPGNRPDAGDEHEILVVVSKLKKYVRDWSGMNTSDGAMAVLSDHLRELCREATRKAGLDSRRTVLDRDFVKVLAERRAADDKRRF